MNPNKYTTSGGVQLQYYTAGTTGPKLVMIHAQGTSSKSFEDVAESMSRKMQVYLIDCPGHGDLPDIPSREEKGVNGVAVYGEDDVVHYRGVVQSVQRHLRIHFGEMAGDVLRDDLLHEFPSSTVVHYNL